MEEKTFTISVYSENNVGLLNRISGIFLKRHINILSLNVSESEIENVSRFIIVVDTTEKWVKNIVGQIEKQIEVWVEVPPGSKGKIEVEVKYLLPPGSYLVELKPKRVMVDTR